MPKLRSVEQLGMDEKTIADPEIEAALEERQKRKDSLGAVKKIYDGAHEAALGAIAKLDLGDDTAVRVGRFRITRSAIAARSVSFDTKPSSRLRISLMGEEG